VIIVYKVDDNKGCNYVKKKLKLIRNTLSLN